MKWIRTERPFPLPPHVRDALQKLGEAGFVAYIVGGSVRDFLLGRDTKDHDIATDADPDRLCELFPNAVTVGKAFGVIKVPIEGQPYPLEIATFREDLEYKDHRHPEGVRFSGPEEDARRRDFTVNALFYDPKSSRILDTVGGMEDLQAKVIRAIGDPSTRFREDALRLLRAIRFATTLGFRLDDATADALRARAKLISQISPERIREELTLMWTGPAPAEALAFLSGRGLLPILLPEVEAVKNLEQNPIAHPDGDLWVRLLKFLSTLARQAPRRSAALGWAAVLHDIGKPGAASRNGPRSYAGNEVEGGRMAEAVVTRFKLPRTDVERVRALIEDHLKFREVFSMRESTLQRFIRQPHFSELLAFHRADAAALDGNMAFYEFTQSRFEELQRQPAEDSGKLLSGEDLIQLGLSPGPRFAEILRTVEDLAFEKKLASKEEALEYVVQHFVK